jgi:hypothetical protein
MVTMPTKQVEPPRQLEQFATMQRMQYKGRIDLILNRIVNETESIERLAVITPSTKLVTLFNWRRIGRGVRKSSSSLPWALPV